MQVMATYQRSLLVAHSKGYLWSSCGSKLEYPEENHPYNLVATNIPCADTWNQSQNRFEPWQLESELQ